MQRPTGEVQGEALRAEAGEAASIEIAARFSGPPRIGHGGYVAGFFFDGLPGAVQVTIRRPSPLDRPLQLDRSGTRAELWHGDDLIAEAEPAELALDVPAAPSPEAARAAAVGSPSFFDGRGVHPTCFGCGRHRATDDGLQIAAGPVEVDGVPQVAAEWVPHDDLADGEGTVRPQMVAAALDCPGAFAFIVSGERAGLLGRIVLEQFMPVQAAVPHVVTGWRIGTEGRKLFAGTAIFSADGSLLAAARATWFPMGS